MNTIEDTRPTLTVHQGRLYQYKQLQLKQSNCLGTILNIFLVHLWGPSIGRYTGTASLHLSTAWTIYASAYDWLPWREQTTRQLSSKSRNGPLRTTACRSSKWTTSARRWEGPVTSLQNHSKVAIASWKIFWFCTFATTTKRCVSCLGPLERFQWRVTASYFMCWYTMKLTPELKQLSDHCDNFAYCLDEIYGEHNRDIRADDSQPFLCALYSFCPDPCCPTKHVTGMEECWDSNENPCHGNAAGDRQCSVSLANNREFR